MKPLFTLATLLPTALLPTTLLPTAALAHQGDHSAVPPSHALTSVDHLAVFLALAVLVGLAATIWVRR